MTRLQFQVCPPHCQDHRIASLDTLGPCLTRQPKPAEHMPLVQQDSHIDKEILAMLLFCCVREHSVLSLLSRTTNTSDEFFTRLYDTLSFRTIPIYTQSSNASGMQSECPLNPPTSLTGEQSVSFTTLASLEGALRTKSEATVNRSRQIH